MSAGRGGVFSATGGMGTIKLKSPYGHNVMFTFVAVGIGAGFVPPKYKKYSDYISPKYGASGSSEADTSVGKVYLLDSFSGAELTSDDIEGFFISHDASIALGRGASGSAMLLGIPASSMPIEVVIQVLRTADMLPDLVTHVTGHPLLVKIAMAPVTGVSLLAALVDKISPSVLGSRAKALLLTGGFNTGGVGVSASATIGYMWSDAASLGPPRGQWMPNLDVPIIETTTTRSALPSQDEADVIRLSGDALFGFDRYDIRPAAEVTLLKAEALIQQKSPRALSVEGHTDAIGDPGYNFVLSTHRADAIKRWLVQRNVMKAEAIQTKGWGKMRPVAPNTRAGGLDDPKGRQKNRRVEIWLIK